MIKNYFKTVSILGMLILGLSGCEKDAETILSIKKPVPVSVKISESASVKINSVPITPPINPVPVTPPKKKQISGY